MKPVLSRLLMFSRMCWIWLQKLLTSSNQMVCAMNFALNTLDMEVQCLSCRKVLTCVFQVCNEMQSFLALQEHNYTQLLPNNVWANKVAYLSCIFKKMEGKNESILCSMGRMQGFHDKLKLWLQCFTNTSNGMFTTVCSLAAGNKMIYVTKQH
jgi:hypothetical protein